MLWREPFLVDAPLGVPDYRDLFLFSHLTASYLRSGCPADRVVSSTLVDAAADMGFLAIGGSQRAAVEAALQRLTGVVIESAIRSRSGAAEACQWGLIESYENVQGQLRVVVDATVAAQIKAGAIALLHRPILLALAREDPLACRLWIFLEAENLKRPFRYRVFGTSDIHPTDHNLAPIAAVLGLGDAKASRVVERLVSAAATIARHDRAYDVLLERSASGRDWNLVASKRPVPGRAADDGAKRGRMAPGRGADGAPGPVPFRRHRRVPDVFTAGGERSSGGPVRVGELLEGLAGHGLDPRLVEEIRGTTRRARR